MKTTTDNGMLLSDEPRLQALYKSIRDNVVSGHTQVAVAEQPDEHSADEIEITGNLSDDDTFNNRWPVPAAAQSRWDVPAQSSRRQQPQQRQDHRRGGPTAAGESYGDKKRGGGKRGSSRG